MKIQCQWKNGMLFSATSGPNELSMDAKKPLGSEMGMTPKELIVAGLCGCTAMDVAGLMKKHKQQVESFTIDASVETSSGGYPSVFTKVDLTFNLKGTIDPQILIQSVELSQTKYCGVSAMLSKAVPISYIVQLNGSNIGSGQAHFA